MENQKVSKGLIKKAVKSLVNKFKDEYHFCADDFEFHAPWIDDYANCLLFTVVKKDSPLFGSTVGYELP